MPDQVRHDTLAPFEAVAARLKTNDPVYKDRVVCLKINQLAVAAERLFFEELFSERTGKADKTGAKKQHAGWFGNGTAPVSPIVPPSSPNTDNFDQSR